jgi:hypothetical protein
MALFATLPRSPASPTPDELQSLNASKTKCMRFNRSLPAPARQSSITTLDGSDLEYVTITNT